MNAISKVDTRWYQTESVNALYNYFGVANGNPLVCLPTGSGKGFVIALFLHSVFSRFPYQRIICATHVKELIEQNYLKLLEVWPIAPAGIFSAGLRQKDIGAPITFAGIKSLVNAVELFGHVDLFIIDEAHLLGPDTDSDYMKVILALMARNPYMKVIGFTATGWRTGMGLLTNGPIFTDIIYDICNIEGFRRLFADYHLVPPQPKRVKTQIDLSGIPIVNGDFAQGAIARAADEKITWAALNEALTHGRDRICRLVFCAGVERAIMTNEMLKAFGLRTAVVHSRMSPGERDGIMKAYRNGELDTLAVNGIGTTGLDVQRIDHIIGLRASTSVGLHVQMNGRGTRPFEIEGWRKLNCLVSDHVGNTKRLGPIDDPYIPKQARKGGGEAPVRICPACDCYNNASARQCMFCGEIFDIQFKAKAVAYDDELIRSDLPAYEWFNVSHVYYTMHEKRNAGPQDRPTIKATYACGLRTFVEFIGLEAAQPYVRKLAVDWWRQRFSDQTYVPSTVVEALKHIDRLVPPKRVEVWVNKKYPSIQSYEY